MEARFTRDRFGLCQTAPRRWRSVLAGLISLALVLSFFHGWAAEDDYGAPTVSIAQIIGESTGTAPNPAAPGQAERAHGDHCLTHLASAIAQDSGIAIEHITQAYRLVSMRAPEAAYPLSPFEPPRT